MNNKPKLGGAVGIIVFFIIAVIIINAFNSIFDGNIIDNIFKKDDKTFRIISSNAVSFYDDELYKFAEKEKIKLTIDHYDDLEIIELLNSETNNYDGVWISNSIWLYMLNNSYLVKNNKSIAITPVVMGIKKSKAQDLGFVNKDISNQDILNAIKNNNLKYVMNSVTKTNTGATAYLNLLNSLAGSPELLKLEMLKDQKIKNDLKEFFKGVERVSGDETYLKDMFIKSDYEAIINYESTLINLNKELEKNNKEPLYLTYPKDGVAINDMPFGYVDRLQNKEENFNKILKFLRSKETSNKLKEYGFRTWFGGVTNEVDKNVFNPSWGIDTSKYLMPFKYPSKTVISEAINLYIEELRKPTHTVFVLDVSGSMNSNNGLVELKESMNYILNRETTSKDYIQFSASDKITVITFNSRVDKVSLTFNGDDTSRLIQDINSLYANGGTNIYDSSIKALDILSKESDEYMKTVILMTDGESNNGSYSSLYHYYISNHLDIPIYSITFGNSSDRQLDEIATLTNAKIFDGKSGLVAAFKEVRSYS